MPGHRHGLSGVYQGGMGGNPCVDTLFFDGMEP